MGRAPCCDKANVKKGPWSPEEDAKLKAYIEQHGTGGNWIALPQKIGLKRCGKSCRLRWLNYLRPNIKHGGFSEEEDNIICSLYISIGSRWSIIAAQLPGRTDNDIKNYWNTRLKKKLLGRRKQSNHNRISSSTDQNGGALEDNTTTNSFQTLSSSALERLQLHMQLQGLHENPLSNYFNNPSLWPKLLPNQHKTILHSLSGLISPNPNSFIQNLLSENPNDQQMIPSQETGMPSLHYSKLNAALITLPDNSNNNNAFTDNMVMDSMSVSTTVQRADGVINQQPVSTLQTELEELLGNNKSSPGSSVIREDDQNMAAGHHDFDYFKEMNNVVAAATKNSLLWWSNINSDQFETNSSSSNSQAMFQDCQQLDYDM